MISLFLLVGCNLSYIVDLFPALHELASASARTLLKLASSVRALKNIIWTCSGGPVTSLSVAFISFAKKVAIDFCQIFSQLLRVLFSLNL